jgi:hypothetical protein
MTNDNVQPPRRPPPTHVYAYVKDGTVLAMIFDHPGLEEQTLAWVGEWLKMGRAVERMTIEEAESRL